jgi:adenylate cyclase
MPGLESHAQVVEALLDGRFLAAATRAQRLLVLGAALALGAWLWIRLPLRGGVLLLAGLQLLLLAAAWGFARVDLALPVFQMQLAVLLLFLSSYALRLSRGERDVLRVREIFSRYVSGDVVETLLASGEMPALGGRAVDVTVLFSDIRNFTSISERLSPEEVVEFLNQWFERACRAVQEEGGSIDKFIGDAIMVEFGAPVAFPDHCRRALRAALKLSGHAQEFQAWMQTRFPDRGLPPFAIGVGLHCGMAVVGNVGSRQRLEYTAIGDTVNLASRLESASKGLKCEIVASRDLVERAGPGVRVGRSDTITVKGREEAVTIVEILGLED